MEGTWVGGKKENMSAEGVCWLLTVCVCVLLLYSVDESFTNETNAPFIEKRKTKYNHTTVNKARYIAWSG